ncbi:MAG: hypothetical protein Q9162_004286 [Coniocarpon cinnabarinum]
MTTTLSAPTIKPTAPLAPADVHILDTTRQRLSVLLTSIDNLRTQLARATTLPAYDTLQEQILTISNQFERTLSHLNRHASFFASAHSYPTPSFPDLNHAGPVTQMLSTAPGVEVEEWVEQGSKLGKLVDESAERDVEGLGRRELDELCGWAAGEAFGVSEETPFGIDFTIAERDSEEGAEGVKTGVKRALNDGMVEVDDEGEELVEEKRKEEGDAKEDEIKPMRLEDVLRFMNTGVLPKG